jgi:hypothetical protein
LSTTTKRTKSFALDRKKENRIAKQPYVHERPPSPPAFSGVQQPEPRRLISTTTTKKTKLKNEMKTKKKLSIQQ